MARSAAYAGADGFSTGESPLRLSCGQLGAELEGQIEEALREFPSTGLIFLDTLQMVRDNASAKVNAYAQDYKDLSGLKSLPMTTAFASSLSITPERSGTAAIFSMI